MFTTFGFSRRRSSLTLLLLMFVLQGCSKTPEVTRQNDVSKANVEDVPTADVDDGEPLAEAFAIANTREHQRAVTILANADIEECIRRTSHETIKISKSDFKSLSNEKRSELQSDMITMAGLIKEAAYKQIDKMKEAQDAGLTEKAAKIQSDIKRLVSELRNDKYVEIYQGCAGGIELKLNEVISLAR